MSDINRMQGIVHIAMQGPTLQAEIVIADIAAGNLYKAVVFFRRCLAQNQAERII